MKEKIHISVLLEESIDHLNLGAGKTIVDCTLGLGGHSKEILKKIGSSGHLIVFEQDEANLKEAKNRLKEYEKQITYVHDNFEHFSENVTEPVDGILFDLGLSSPHVDNPKRGFAFKTDGPLDMRFDKRQKLTAEYVVNKYNEKDLADIIYHFGEERKSRIIARKIIEERKREPITSTSQLAEIIKSIVKGRGKTHPATQTFQALRIYVNRELEVLEKALEQAISKLKKGGRIVVISYHSLEDRIVKKKFKYYTQDCICPKELPVCQCNFKKKLYILTKKPIIPNGIEAKANPRARSAKMRVAERI